MRCSKCGTPINPEDQFCRHCGSAVQIQMDTDPVTVESPDQGVTFAGISEEKSEETIMDPIAYSRKKKVRTQTDNKSIPVDDRESKSGKIFRKVTDILKDEESEIETREIDEDFEGNYRRFVNNQKIKKDKSDSFHKNAYPAPDFIDKRGEEKPRSKKWIIILAIILILACLAVLGYAVYNKMNVERFTDEDAKQLVQIELDAISSGKVNDNDGNNDNQEEFSNVNEEALKLRQEYIETTKNSIVTLLENNKFTVSEEQSSRISQIIEQALVKSNYTVEGASQVTDDNFAVTVQVKPLELYRGLDQKFIRELTGEIVSNREEIAKDRSLLYGAVLDGMMDHILDVTLKEPVFKNEESISVKVQKNDQEVWTVNQDDIKKIAEKLIYTDEFLQNAS